MSDVVRIAVTLPTFGEEIEPLVDVARRAEAVGLDAVFTYDHLFGFRRTGSMRPALSLEPVLGVLAVETRRMAFGSLVARATVRKSALLRTVFDTAARLAPGRLIAGVGSGDRESDPEQAMFGLVPEEVPVRLSALEHTLDTVSGRGYPVWVGGRSDRVIATAAAKADGWNAWGIGPDEFEHLVRTLGASMAAADRVPGSVTPSWGGLVELRPERWADASERDDVLSGGWDAMAEQLARYVDAGAEWLVLAPLDAADPEGVAAVGEELLPRLRT